MAQRSVRGRSVAWSGINAVAIDLMVSATIVICSASILAMALGDLDTMALVAGLGAVVILLALAIISNNRHLSVYRSAGMGGPA